MPTAPLYRTPQLPAQGAAHRRSAVATTVMPDPIPVVALGITPLVVVQDLFVQLRRHLQRNEVGPSFLPPIARHVAIAERQRDGRLAHVGATACVPTPPTRAFPLFLLAQARRQPAPSRGDRARRLRWRDPRRPAPPPTQPLHSSAAAGDISSRASRGRGLNWAGTAVCGGISGIAAAACGHPQPVEQPRQQRGTRRQRT